MRLSKLSVQNFRSIRSLVGMRIEALQALVGENNCGKSNIIRAIECFLTAGTGGVEISDFNDSGLPISIECEFTGLSATERRKLRPYLLGDHIVLHKELTLATDGRGKTSIGREYHGYQAEPSDLHLSIAKIEAQGKPNWEKLATDHGLIDAARTAEGRVTKASYKAAVDKYLVDNDVLYDVAVLGQTQTLGIAQNLLSVLPEFYLLPAITDYSTEIDRRSSSTVFRKLMTDLSERLLKADARYVEIEAALATIRDLLNQGAGATQRLTALAGVETTLRDTVRGLMPTVQGVSIAVEIDRPKDVFSKGVSIKIDDGVLTDVLEKGSGMQRCLIFALLQMLIGSGRADVDNAVGRSILLAIEEPELYIHPHCQRLIFGVLRSFAGYGSDSEPTKQDQVLYTTHSSSFIEIANYDRIAVVRKTSTATGTTVRQCEIGILGDAAERTGFKLLTSFGLEHNELFFAKYVVLVEGVEDDVGIIATARKLRRIKELPDEIGLSIVVTHGKGGIPKFEKVLNAFGIDFAVLIELDGRPANDPQTAPIFAELRGNRSAQVPGRVEDILNVGRHFDDQWHAMKFFSDENRITPEMERVVTELLPSVVPAAVAAAVPVPQQ